MEPKISVRRKGDVVYLKLAGQFSDATAHDLLQAMTRMVLSQLRYALPDSQVSFTFMTNAQVGGGRRPADANGGPRTRFSAKGATFKQVLALSGLPSSR
jgi:hypothetical protein